MLRRMLRTVIDDVEAGRNPLGVGAPGEPVRHVESGAVIRREPGGDTPSPAGA
jgi:hypothetical protein